MKVLSLEAPRAIEDTVQTMQHGGIIAFPTDTVYGLGASIRFPAALERIFAIKGREATKPLPVLLSSIDGISLVADIPDERVLALLREFWPGALTIAMPARSDVPPQIVAPDGTVGVRVPDYSVALMLCERAGGALAVTSANRSGTAPARSAEEIVDQFESDEIDVVLDGGYAPHGEPSTVIRVDNARIATIRAGSIVSERLEEAWSRIA